MTTRVLIQDPPLKAQIEIWRALGGIGMHKTRVRFSRLGAARGRVFKLGMSDPVRTAISAVEVDAEPART